MIRAISVKPHGAWMGSPADIVVLDAEARHCRRVTMKAVRGLEFLVDLPQAVGLRGGDALVLEDGRLVEVLAQPEPLAEITCKDPRQLMRLAYHFGNRHLPVQILGQKLRIRHDHVIEDMARQGGARVTEIEAPFDFEAGAYAAEAAAADSHGHDHHAHDHHDHAHDDHVHGPDCDHHGHDHH